MGCILLFRVENELGGLAENTSHTTWLQDLSGYMIYFEPLTVPGFRIYFEPLALHGFRIYFEPLTLPGFRIYFEPFTLSGYIFYFEPFTLPGFVSLNSVRHEILSSFTIDSYDKV